MKVVKDKGFYLTIRKTNTNFLILFSLGISYSDDRLITLHPIHHGRTKHINVRFHALRDAEKSGEINLVHCITEEQ